MFAYSCVCHMSAIVPPTKVAPVDPAAPWKNLKMITVPMFFDLEIMLNEWGSWEATIKKCSYSAIGKEHRAKTVLVIRYNGRRPNSSEKLAVNSGVMARPINHDVRHEGK